MNDLIANLQANPTAVALIVTVAGVVAHAMGKRVPFLSKFLTPTVPAVPGKTGPVSGPILSPSIADKVSKAEGFFVTHPGLVALAQGLENSLLSPVLSAKINALVAEISTAILPPSLPPATVPVGPPAVAPAPVVAPAVTVGMSLGDQIHAMTLHSVAQALVPTGVAGQASAPVSPQS